MREESEVERAVDDAHRREWATVLAATVRVARDLDLAEDCVQEAYAAALGAWARDGVPARPAAWLTTIARRRALDAVRRETTLRAKLPLLLDPSTAVDPGIDPDGADEVDASWEAEAAVPDERLRLIFMCCHPALAPEAQMALTLKLACGVPTADIARAFLVSETTMGARLTRAKRKISAARIPFRVPAGADLPDRVRAVLGVVYLLFTMGHTAPSGSSLIRVDLVDQALRLGRVVRDLLPGEREARGLLALMLVTSARTATRVDAAGRLLRLADQDRSQWDRAVIAESQDLLAEVPGDGRPGRYVLQAEIALVHTVAPTADEVDWPRIVRLYDDLRSIWPSPVVALNRAVALSMVSGPLAALAEVEELEKGGRLAGYQYLPAVKADLLQRLGRAEEASHALQSALDLTRNATEREFLAARLGRLR